MTLKMKKTAVSMAVGLALGVAVAQAQAAAISTIKVEDVGGFASTTAGSAFSSTLGYFFGLFRFAAINAANPPAPATPFWTGDAGTGTMTFGPNNAAGSFSTGFNFAGSPFVPFLSAGAAGEINGTCNDAASCGTTAMTFSSLPFGGFYTVRASTLTFRRIPVPCR